MFNEQIPVQVGAAKHAQYYTPTPRKSKADFTDKMCNPQDYTLEAINSRMNNLRESLGIENDYSPDAILERIKKTRKLLNAIDEL